jgi:hypothetical protein
MVILQSENILSTLRLKFVRTLSGVMMSGILAKKSLTKLFLMEKQSLCTFVRTDQVVKQKYHYLQTDSYFTESTCKTS